MRPTTTIALFSTLIILLACTNPISDKQKVRKVIDQGLAKNAACKPVPIGIAVSKDDLEKSAALAQLVAQGYATSSEIESSTSSKKTVPGYIFTEKGRSLVQTPSKLHGWFMSPPCVRHGQYKVKTIEAIDAGTTSAGVNVANVRATIEFSPEEWLKATRQLEEWAPFWRGTQKIESEQWVYQLIKSGDDFFFVAMGQPLK